jgi:hypothetical protein
MAKNDGYIIGGLAAAAGIGIYLASRKSTPAPGTAGLYGVVTDLQSGLPVAGALISPVTATGFHIIGQQTDSKGQYAFANMVPGTYTIGTTKDGYYESDHVVTLVEGANQLNIQILATVTWAVLSGHVSNSLNNPVPNVKVTITSHVMLTDENGDYHFQLLAGTYAIKFENSLYVTQTDNITITEGTNTHDVVLQEVAPLPGPAHLFGVVTDSITGAPIDNVQIDLYTYRSFTNTSGQYDIGGIDISVAPGGSFAIAFSAVDYQFTSSFVTLTPGDNQFNFTLKPVTNPPPPPPPPPGPNDPQIISLTGLQAASGGTYWPSALLKLPAVGDAYRVRFQINPAQLNGSYTDNVMQFDFSKAGPNPTTPSGAIITKLDSATEQYTLTGQGYNFVQQGGTGDPNLYQAMEAANEIDEEAGAAEQAAEAAYNADPSDANRAALESAVAASNSASEAYQAALDAYYATVTPITYGRVAVPAEAIARYYIWNYVLAPGPYEVIGSIFQTIAGQETEFNFGQIGILNVT